MERVDAWLRSVLWDNKLPHDTGNASQFEIHRLKGRLALSNGQTKVVQGVRELFDIFDPAGSGGEVTRSSKMVLIGRHLDGFDWEGSLKATVEAAGY